MIIGAMQPTPLPQPVSGPPFSGAVRLADWGVIRAQGADAAMFLHGQLTQDVLHLDRAQARLAGYCSVKGRLLASFVLWRSAEDEFMLACSADLLAASLKRLSMFVLRAKCKLSDASQEVSLYGVVGAAAAAWLDEAAPRTAWAVDAAGPAQVIRLPDAMDLPRHLVAQPSSLPPPPGPELSTADWQWLEVRSAVTRIVAATADQFVPQMVNLELVGGVDFQKGCYPGQEVVARSQYRGTLKRRAMLFDCDALPSPGQEIFHSHDPGQPAGMVANAAPGPGGGFSALVQVKLAAVAQGSLHLGSADGPLLRPLALPYAIPADSP